MRRIKTDAAFHNKVKDFNDNLFKTLKKLPLKNLENLRKQTYLKAKYKMPADVVINYIKHIELHYQRILSANEKTMKVLITEFEGILNGKVITEKFHKAIVGALRYDALRAKDFPNFIRQHNIKTCSYCHSQSTIIVEKENGTLRALFELDHKYAKSKYPFLATSFYNLYPICGNCNLAKSDAPSAFELYTDADNLDLLTFGMEDISVVKFLDSKDPNDLKITITPVTGQEVLFDDYLKMFMIKEIYDMQIDIATELVVKSQIYNDEYKDLLVKNFGEVFSDTSIINRLIIGNYDKPEEMMMRSTAKFVQEIARDIGLIPKLPEK
jgi:hypothetical protein